jgi:hypothetical protein
MKTIHANPLDHAIDLLFRWGALRHHHILAVKKLSSIEWMTVCEKCGNEYHITRTDTGFVMNLDDETCTKRRATVTSSDPSEQQEQ